MFLVVEKYIQRKKMFLKIHKTSMNLQLLILLQKIIATQKHFIILFFKIKKITKSMPLMLLIFIFYASFHQPCHQPA